MRRVLPPGAARDVALKFARRRLLPACPAWIALACAAAAPCAGQSLLLSEIAAINDGELLDEDGDASDWFEVYNPEPVAIDLDGWSATDDSTDARKWSFPARTLQPGEFLIVFASEKDRSAPGGPLHTSFKLTSAGEYLALVRPDGSVSHAFDPFPPQYSGISYGLAGEGAALIAPGAPVDYLVPADGSLGATWTATAFVPGAGWQRGASGLGFEVEAGGPGLPAPVAHWPLDGDTLDSSGNHDGSFEGEAAPRFESGHDGRAASALQLDGLNDHVDVATAPGLPIHNRAAYTVALWVKGMPQGDRRVYAEGSIGNNAPLFTLGTDASGATGKVDVYIRGNDSTVILNHRLSQGIAFDGQWHHIAWVDTGGDAALYIDGVLDAQSFDYVKTPLSLDITALGAVLRASACCFFAGAIDDAAVWDLALTPAEIAALAAGGSPAGGGHYSRHIGTSVESLMHGARTSIYARLPFTVADASRLDALAFTARYDDGLVVYLNGQEVARRNAPATPAWSSTATASHAGAVAVAAERIDLTGAMGLLRTGGNVLAVHGLNHGASDGTFLLAPELSASGFLAGEARYFSTPTPGAVNTGGSIDFVADTKFSVDRGFFTAPFNVSIATTTPGATIRYTLDGSAPTEATGLVYTGPVRIARTTALRAAAFKPGFEPTNTDTHTFIFLDDVIRQSNAQPGYPTVWQPGWAADYEMDPEICLNAASPVHYPTIKDDLLTIPTLSLALSPDDFLGPVRGIYNHSESRGLAWERPASAELIFPDGSEEGFQINCGLRMQGGASRDPVRQLKHSFRLLFKDEYGPKRLRYRWFKDTRVDSFNTIILRAFFTDGWSTRYQEPRYRPDDSQYIRDLWMKDSQLDMGQPAGHGSYVHVYVNGLYWGLFNATERPDAAYQAGHFGGDESEWDVFKDATEVMDGDRQAWDQLMSAASAGFSTAAAYHRVQGNNPDGTRNPAFPLLLDVDNLIDYMALHIFAGSEDWPHHNWFAARRRGALSTGWRFFSWDQEIVLDELTRDRTGVADASSPALVYSRLRQNAEFRLRFADRVHKHFFNDGALTTGANRDRWMERAAQIDRAVVPESARWGDRRREPPFTRDVEWLREQDVVINDYLPDILPITINRLRAAGLYPQLAAPELVPHGGKIARGGLVAVTAPTGAVHYTLDGTDPRLEGGAVSPSALTFDGAGAEILLASRAAARYLVPAGPELALDWTQRGFNDQAWTPGTTGIGYDRTGDFTAEIGTDVDAAMYDINGSIYIRVRFDVQDPARFDRLTLRMKYDDGFVAYINGRRVADRNAPASPAWSSLATAGHADPDALVFEEFDISAHVDALVAGSNVLALHGLNASPTSTDLLQLPEIAAGGGGRPVIAIEETGVVKARVLDGGQWSALTEAAYFVDEPLLLRVTELHYHPPETPREDEIDPADLEFIEIANAGEKRVWLLGVKLAASVDFDFSTGAIAYLEPGDVVLAVRSIAAFTAVRGEGLPVAGQYEGNLDNAGELVRLEDPFGGVIQEFVYEDAWHPETDGAGPSLVCADARAPLSAWNTPQGWRPSEETGGTPGVHPLDPAGAGGQIPGDTNQDADLDLSDAVALLRLLFLGGGDLPCEGEAPGSGSNLILLDVNSDQRVDLSDAVYSLRYLFTGGPPPALGTACIRIDGCPDRCAS